jgi:hypothetical protein
MGCLSISVDEGAAGGGGRSQGLNVVSGLSEIELGEGLSCSEGLQYFLEGSISPRLEPGKKVGQALPHLPDHPTGLEEVEGKRKTDLV